MIIIDQTKIRGLYIKNEGKLRKIQRLLQKGDNKDIVAPLELINTKPNLAAYWETGNGWDIVPSGADIGTLRAQWGGTGSISSYAKNRQLIDFSLYTKLIVNIRYAASSMTFYFRLVDENQTEISGTRGTGNAGEQVFDLSNINGKGYFMANGSWSFPNNGSGGSWTTGNCFIDKVTFI